jgi:hypothetical protein
MVINRYFIFSDLTRRQRSCLAVLVSFRYSNFLDLGRYPPTPSFATIYSGPPPPVMPLAFADVVNSATLARSRIDGGAAVNRNGWVCHPNSLATCFKSMETLQISPPDPHFFVVICENNVRWNDALLPDDL